MPEMCVPSYRINYNRVLRQLVSLITDGRYSGTNFGVSVGHVTPEAMHGGGITYLQTGDLMHLRFRDGRLDLLDRAVFISEGRLAPYGGNPSANPSLSSGGQALAEQRAGLGLERLSHLERRGRKIAPSNRMFDHTDAAHGVVPHYIAEWASIGWTYRDKSVGIGAGRTPRQGRRLRRQTSFPRISGAAHSRFRRSGRYI